MKRRHAAAAALIVSTTAVAADQALTSAPAAQTVAAPVVQEAAVVRDVMLRPPHRISRTLQRVAPPKIVKKKAVVKKPTVVTKPRVVVRHTYTYQGTLTGNRAIGQRMAAARGWVGQQFVCLDSLVNRESHWSTTAHNPSGAYGIPQALPGSKMGPGWQTDPVVQIRWMLSYIASRYSTPCGAWNHSLATGWY